MKVVPTFYANGHLYGILLCVVEILSENQKYFLLCCNTENKSSLLRGQLKLFQF